jgi:hypothetical protein
MPCLHGDRLGQGEDPQAHPRLAPTPAEEDHR